jgi:hypothetical protein
MARKVVNASEIRAAFAADQAKREKASRSKKLPPPPPVDPAFRVLKLDDGLLRSHFAWCPDSQMPAVAPNSSGLMVCGQLHLRMQHLGGLRSLWDLVDKSGWLVIEGLWLDTDPREQYLLVAARLSRGGSPGGTVNPLELWRLWQPSYRPRFECNPNGADGPSAEMREALDETLGKHLKESVRPWEERQAFAQFAELTKDIEALSKRIQELDEQRRGLRRVAGGSRDAMANVRRTIVEAEAQLAVLSEAIASVTPPTVPTIRQRLCEVKWFVQPPEARNEAF